jgi:hypothetical protein
MCQLPLAHHLQPRPPALQKVQQQQQQQQQERAAAALPLRFQKMSHLQSCYLPAVTVYGLAMQA